MLSYEEKEQLAEAVSLTGTYHLVEHLLEETGGSEINLERIRTTLVPLVIRVFGQVDAALFYERVTKLKELSRLIDRS